MIMDIPKKKQEEILETARERFKLVTDSEEKQREREIEDLRFLVPELQWSEEARAQRQTAAVAAKGGTVNLPARPIISIPKIHQPVQMILNQEKASRLGVRVHPLSEKANRDTAKVFQGLYRKIERDSNAALPRSWAFTRAVEAGRGAYRVNLAYDDESEHPFDMKIVLERILYQENVFFDPSAQNPDWSDGEWAFNAAWVPIDTFKRDYPKANLSHPDPLHWQDVHKEAPNWVKMDGDKVSACLVAEYFYKEYENERIILVETEMGPVPLPVPKGEKVPDTVKILDERERKVPTVKWVKMAGLDILDGADWAGKYIPLIPVVGRELIPFDQERRWTGVVRPARDAQRMYNYAASSLVELAALEPRAPWILNPDQIEGYEDWWQQSNVRNFPFLPYNATGESAHPPQRVQIDASRLGPSMMMLQQADDMIQSSTQLHAASMGDLPSKERSGKAIQELKQQGDAANSDWIQNLAQISMRYEAKVVLDLMPTAYQRPGRVVEILEDEAGKTRNIMLGVPFQEQDGKVQPFQGQGAKFYDLKKGAYSVSIHIGKAYQSRLQAGADEIGHLLAQQPDLFPIMGPIYLKFRDFPGSEQMADDAYAWRAAQFPGVFDQDEQSPEAIRAQMIQLKRQNMQMKQQMQQMQQEIQTDAVKAKATLEKAQIDAGSRTQVAQIESQFEVIVQKLKDEADRREQTMEQAFKAQMEALERRHEMLMLREKNASEERQAQIRKRETRAGGAE